MNLFEKLARQFSEYDKYLADIVQEKRGSWRGKGENLQAVDDGCRMSMFFCPLPS
jgi:hypothetical protein